MNCVYFGFGFVENYNAEIKIDFGFEYLVCIDLLMRGTPLFLHEIKTKNKKTK